MNKVVLIGRITKDPELRFIPGSGVAVCTFSIAVDRRKVKDKEQVTDFFKIVVWGKQGENVANYMSKGKLIGISGRIENRSYEGNDGIKRYVTEIVAEEVQFLEKKSDTNTANSNNTNTENQEYNEWDSASEDDDEIPF